MSRKHGRKPMAQINVVPYIDVMLVLLVIFMVTAPMVNQGVNVELPKASAEPLSQEDAEPLIISVDKSGNMFINIGDDKESPQKVDVLQARVAAVLRNKPNTPILVRGDRSVDYGKVVEAMVFLKAAGAPNVGLITESPE